MTLLPGPGATVLHAQTEAGPVESDPEIDETQANLELDPSWDWTVRIRPMLWVPGLSGDMTLPLSSKIDVETVNADETRVTPAGQFDLQIDRLSIQFRGFGFALDSSAGASESFILAGTPIVVGQPVRTQIDLSSFDLTGGYRVWTPVEDPEREVRLSIDLYGGLRFHALDMTVRSGSIVSQGDETWAQPIVGARLVMDLPHRFQITAALDGGGLPFGENSSSSWDVTASFLWRVHPNVGAEIGFRHHSFSLQSGSGIDEFGYSGWLAGLYAALTIRF